MNEADDRGRTLLYVASRKGKTQFVNKALKFSSGDTVDMCNQSGKSALYAAAVSGDEEIVEILIKAGARVNLRDLKGRTALWAAMYHGCAGTVQRLINLGADPNQSDYDGTTPLIAAAAGESKMGPKHNRLCVTKLLTFADDDEVMVNAKENNTGCAAVWAAAASGNTGVLLELLSVNSTDVNEKNKFGRSPLQAASLGGHCECVLALIAAGANIDAKDDDGETALYAAAFENHPATVVVLVSSGADVDGGMEDDRVDVDDANDATDASKENTTPSKTATKKSIKKSSIGKVHSSKTPPPLVGACWRGNAAAVAALLADGPGQRPDLERVTDDGRTALTASCWRGHHHCVKLLLAAGAEVNHPDADGRTAMWAAARAGDATSVRLCVERGSDVDKKDARRDAFSAGAGVTQCTPLFAAVWQEEFEAVAALLAAGADPSEGDGEGRSPLSLVDTGSSDHTETNRRIRDALTEAVAVCEKKPESLLESKFTRTAAAAVQARRAETWAEKREERKGTASELFLDANTSALGDVSSDEEEEEGLIVTSDVKSDSPEGPSGDPSTEQPELSSKEQQARISRSQRKAAVKSLRKIQNAITAFRAAANEARDAERNTTVRIKPESVDCTHEVLVDATNTAAGKNKSIVGKKKTMSKVASRSRKVAQKSRAPEKSPQEILRLQKAADEARTHVRLLLKTRSSQIKSSLMNLPDALERIRACANAAAEEKEKALERKRSEHANLNPNAKPRRKSMWNRLSFAAHKTGTVVTLDDDGSDSDDGWGFDRGRYESKNTAGVLGSE